MLNVAKFAPLLSPFFRKILRQLKPQTLQSQSKFDPVLVMQLKSRPAGNTVPLLLVFSLWKFTAIFVIISSHIAALMESVIILWEKKYAELLRTWVEFCFRSLLSLKLTTKHDKVSGLNFKKMGGFFGNIYFFLYDSLIHN
jgi:hypothetical protein